MVLQGSLTRHQNPNATGSDKSQLCEVLQHTRYCLVFWFQFTITNVRCKLQSPLGLRHSQNLLLTHLQAVPFSFLELHFSRGESFFSLSTSWLSSLYRFLPLQRHRLLSKKRIVVIPFVPICELGVGGTTFATIHARVMYFYCWQY